MTDELIAVKKELARLREECARSNDRICQTLGQVLGFPWYKDNQDFFPGATEEDGVCVGPYGAEDLAILAAERIKKNDR